MFGYLAANYIEISKLILQHLFLTMLSLSIAIIIAIPTGYLLSKNKIAENITLSAFGAIYTIPSLALFAILIPITGLGLNSAVITLVIYSLFIITRNTLTGFKSIDTKTIESAKGLGLNKIQLFMQIELPYALPEIIGGIRIASVSIIGIASIAAWINAGGLGVMIFDGLYKNFFPEIAIGTGLISILAILMNSYFLGLQNNAINFLNGEK